MNGLFELAVNSIAPIRDRVVHMAVVNILEPIYEAYFIDDSYIHRVLMK